MWITKRCESETLLTLSNSQVTFYFPDASKKETVFYGYAGTQNEDFVNTRVLYQMQYKVSQDVAGVHKFRIDDKSVITLDEKKSATSCSFTINSIIGALKFEL